MRARAQLATIVILAAATWGGLLRVAESKSDEAAGGGAFRLAVPRHDELAAFARLRSDLERYGEEGTAASLEALRAKGAIWVAPRLDRGRWAVYVSSLGLVRRIYVRGEALRDPAGHLFAGVASEAPPAHREAFARMSLAGALVHELAHHDGIEDEGAAYELELGWYERVRKSPFVAGLPREARAAYDWAIESAILSARAARRRAGAAGASS